MTNRTSGKQKKDCNSEWKSKGLKLVESQNQTQLKFREKINNKEHRDKSTSEFRSNILGSQCQDFQKEKKEFRTNSWEVKGVKESKFEVAKNRKMNKDRAK